MAYYVFRIIQGMTPANRCVLKNPESLDFYERMKVEFII